MVPVFWLWLMVGWFALEALLRVAVTGYRADLTPGGAVFVLLLNATIITILVLTALNGVRT